MFLIWAQMLQNAGSPSEVRSPTSQFHFESSFCAEVILISRFDTTEKEKRKNSPQEQTAIVILSQENPAKLPHRTTFSRSAESSENSIII
jgi:hypothetical protein